MPIMIRSLPNNVCLLLAREFCFGDFFCTPETRLCRTLATRKVPLRREREGLLNIWIQINGLKIVDPSARCRSSPKFSKPVRRNDVNARGSANRAPPASSSLVQEIYLASKKDVELEVLVSSNPVSQPSAFSVADDLVSRVHQYVSHGYCNSTSFLSQNISLGLTRRRPVARGFAIHGR